MQNPQLDRPQIQRTQVVAKDVLTGKSRSKTIYGATPDTVIDTLEKAITNASQSSAEPTKTPNAA